MWQIVHYIDIDICTRTQSLPCCLFSTFSLSNGRRSSVVQNSSWLVHAHGSYRPWVSFCFCETRTVHTVILTSHMVAEPVLWDYQFIRPPMQGLGLPTTCRDCISSVQSLARNIPRLCIVHGGESGKETFWSQTLRNWKWWTHQNSTPDILTDLPDNHPLRLKWAVKQHIVITSEVAVST